MNLLGTQDMSVSQDPTAPPAAVATTAAIAVAATTVATAVAAVANLMCCGGGIAIHSTKYK